MSLYSEISIVCLYSDMYVYSCECLYMVSETAFSD